MAKILGKPGKIVRNLLVFVAIYLTLFVGALATLRLIYYGMLLWGAAIGTITCITAVMLYLVGKIAAVREQHRRRRRLVAEARRKLAASQAGPE